MAPDVSPKATVRPEAEIAVTPSNPIVFNPSAGRLPTPEAMAAYAAIDSSYPDFLKSIFSAELKRNYQYQLITLIAGWSFGTLLLAGSIFLTYTNHPKMALSFLGANALGLAARMLTKSATRSI